MTISDWLYAVPLFLMLYSILMCFLGDYDYQTNIKRIYYTICLFAYLFFIKHYDVSGWCDQGLFGLSPEIWSVLLSILVAFLIAIVIDNFIISGYVFKEFGFFGAKFIKEETKKTVIDQNGYLQNLEKSLEALYDIFYYIHGLFMEAQVLQEIKDGTFLYPLQFARIIKAYYEFKSEFVIANVKFYRTTDMEINSLVHDYAAKNNMSRSQMRKLKSCINKRYGNSGYFDLGNTKIFIITAKVMHCKEDEMLMISIQSKNEINIFDIYPILSFLSYFELEISKL